MVSRECVLTGITFACFVACHPASQPPITPQPSSAICYHLQFGKWAAGDTALPFAAASIGPHMPLPEILALTRDVARTGWKTPSYVALRRPQESDQLAGSWATFGHDSVFVVLPLIDGSALRIRVIGSEERIGGAAWISPKEASDTPLPVTGASVEARMIECPDSLGLVRSGA